MIINLKPVRLWRRTICVKRVAVKLIVGYHIEIEHLNCLKKLANLVFILLLRPDELFFFIISFSKVCFNVFASQIFRILL